MATTLSTYAGEVLSAKRQSPLGDYLLTEWTIPLRYPGLGRKRAS